jgi:hypothetical protein
MKGLVGRAALEMVVLAGPTIGTEPAIRFRRDLSSNARVERGVEHQASGRRGHEAPAGCGHRTNHRALRLVTKECASHFRSPLSILVAGT